MSADIQMCKFIVPAQAVSELRHELSLAGITDAIIYPELDGLCHELKREFRIKQMYGLVDGALGRLKNFGSAESHPDTAQAIETIKGALERWRAALDGLPETHPAWSEYFGVEGATYKQRAELTDADPTSLFSHALESYERAAALTLKNHWVMTQALCLALLLGKTPPPG